MWLFFALVIILFAVIVQILVPYLSTEFDESTIASLLAEQTRESPKSFVITGANSGLGLSSAKLLARNTPDSSSSSKGIIIIMACRNTTKCQLAQASIRNELFRRSRPESDNNSNVILKCLQLDLANISSVTQFVDKTQQFLRETHNIVDDNGAAAVPLNVLINNAGIMMPADTNNGGVEEHILNNHLGHFHLTTMLMPNILQGKGGGGRVVNVSSLASITALFFPIRETKFYGNENKGDDEQENLLKSIVSYGQSKLANSLFTNALHTRYCNTNNANVINGRCSAVTAHPGYSRTSLMLTGWNFFPMSVRNFCHTNRILSMSSDTGSLSQLRAALDLDGVGSDGYVGPLLGVCGRPIVVGTSLKNMVTWMWTIKEKHVDNLWEWSEEAIRRIQ